MLRPRSSWPFLVAAATCAAAALGLGACSSFSSDGAGGGEGDAGADRPILDGTPQQPPADDAGDAAAPPCDLGKDFGAPTEVPGVNSGQGDRAAWLTPDETTIYFATDRDGANNTHIYRGTRSGPGKPFAGLALASMNLPSTNDDHPTLAADESWMFLVRGASPRDIYFAPKAAKGFTPVLASGDVNSPHDEIEPFYAAATGALLFASQRGGPYAVYSVDVALPDGGTGNNAVPIANVNASNTVAPVLSADGRTLFFATDRDTGGKYAIYAATRGDVKGDFGAPRALSSIAPAQAGDERPSWVSPDGCRLYLTSARQGPARIYVAEKPK